MAVIHLKRSAVPGKVPLITDLALGEIGVNTFDGRVFIKKDNGAQSIVEVTGGEAALPLTTKGDIVVHDGTTAVRQAVGVNGKQLVADSTRVTGVVWGTGTQYNQSTAAQGPGFAADTYLTGSSIAIPASSLKVGSRYRVVFDVSKTAAGTAAPSIFVRFGTSGSASDAGRATLAFPVQTAAADDGRFEVLVTFQSGGAATVIQAIGTLTHRLQVTGLSNLPSPTVRSTSVAFDSTIANSTIGVSVVGGASAAWTVRLVHATLENLV
jgi:hypothetical protein